MPKKLLLINAPISIYINKTAFAPLPLLVLGRSLRELQTNGYDISYEILDLDLLLKQGQLPDDERFLEKATRLVLDKRPHILLFTVHGLSHISVLQISEQIKARCPSCCIVAGGVGPTLKAKEALTRCNNIDIIVKGEGETVLKQLVPALLEGRALDEIPSIVYRHKGEVIENSRPQGRFETEIPAPDYSLINLEAYIRHNQKHPFIHPGLVLIESGRGCRHQCAFCAPAKMWGGTVRYRPIADIMEEMQFLASKGGRFCFFTQDNLEEKFLIDLSNALIEKQIDIPWGCYSRLDRLSDHIAPLLSAAGCRLIFTGIETTNRATQKTIRKMIDAPSTFDKLRHYNENEIRFIGSFIAGFTDETGDDLNETMRFALECSAGMPIDDIYRHIAHVNQKELPQKNLNICSIHPLCYMPGTDTFEKESGRLHISRYALHPDCYGSFLFGYEQFKDDWSFLGVNPYLNHLPEARVRYYCAVLRIFNFLNSRPLYLALLLSITETSPLEFTEKAAKALGDEFVLTATIEVFESEAIRYAATFLDYTPEWTAKKRL